MALMEFKLQLISIPNSTARDQQGGGLKAFARSQLWCCTGKPTASSHPFNGHPGCSQLWSIQPLPLAFLLSGRSQVVIGSYSVFLVIKEKAVKIPIVKCLFHFKWRLEGDGDAHSHFLVGWGPMCHHACSYLHKWRPHLRQPRLLVAAFLTGSQCLWVPQAN